MSTTRVKLLRLPIQAGATFVRSFRLLDSDRLPVDRTGWTAAFQARRDADDPDPAVLTAVPTIGGVDGNVVTLTLTAAQTSSIGSYRQLVWAIELYAPGPGPVYEPTETPLTGIADIEPEIVR